MRRAIFALFAGIVATLAQAADDVLIDDFESGRFDTWTVEGTAFGKGPLAIEGLDRPRAKSPSPADW